MEQDMIPSEKSSMPLGNYPSYPSGAKGVNISTESKTEAQLEAKHPQERQDMHLEKWYDNYEVMEMFHISQRTLQTLRSNGKLPFAKLGNKCFYREQDLQHMMMESFRDSRVKFAEHDTQNEYVTSHKKEGGGSWE